MNRIFFGLLALSFSCGGNLSDEQRKKFREGIENQKIVKISEAEIMDAALLKGKQVLSGLKTNSYSPATADSLQSIHKVKIKWTVPGAANALAVEQELIDAYIAGMATGTMQENVQKIYSDGNRTDYDSLLFSQPKVETLPDGSEQLEGIWNIYIAKKQLVLDISKTK